MRAKDRLQNAVGSLHRKDQLLQTVHERWDRCALPRHGLGPANFVGSGSGIHLVRTVRHAFASNSNGSRHVAAERARAADDELVPGKGDWLDVLSPGMLWRADELSFSDSGRTALTLNTLLRIWFTGPNHTLTFGTPHFLSFTLKLSSGPTTSRIHKA